MKTNKTAIDHNAIHCIIDGSNGVYCPKVFAERYLDDNIETCLWSGYDTEQYDILIEGPDHKHYWDVWDEIIDSVRYIDQSHIEWRIDQEDSVFVIQTICEWDHERDEYIMPDLYEYPENYDVAMPQEWFDRALQVSGINPAGHIVWSYDGTMLGLAYSVDTIGDSIIEAMLENTINKG